MFVASAMAMTGKCWKMTAAGNPADPAFLQEDARPVPEVKPDQVLVKVTAAALNPIDYKICEGKVSVVTTPPLIPAGDFAGVVEEAGANSGFTKGQDVFGDVINVKGVIGGSLSEFILVPANVIAIVPKGVSHTDACSISLVGQTALDCFEKAAPPAGARLLVLGASGGVGSAAVQIYKAKGCTVIGVCSDKNVDMVRGLGADEVIDYKKDDWSLKLADAKVDVVFDFAPSSSNNSAETWSKAMNVLRPGGLFSAGGSCINISGEEDGGQVTIGGVLTSMIKMAWRNSFSGFKFYPVLKKSDSKKLQELAGLIESGKLRPVVEKIYPFSQAHAAFAHLMSGRTVGKVVVSVA